MHKTGSVYYLKQLLNVIQTNINLQLHLHVYYIIVENIANHVLFQFDK